MTESLISAAVIAAIISTLIGGYFNVVWQNKIQYNNDINTFRYTKLYELNVELSSLTPPSYDLSDMQRIANQSAQRHTTIESIYNRAVPLVEKKHRQNTDQLRTKEVELSNNLVDMIYSDKKISAENPLLKNLLLKRQEFEKSVKMSFSVALLSMLE